MYLSLYIGTMMHHQRPAFTVTRRAAATPERLLRVRYEATL